MLSVPDIQPSPQWDMAWTGFLLDQRSKGRSPKTIKNRRSNVMLLARWCTGQGEGDPEKVTKAVMKAYLAAQLEGRQGSGASTMYQDLRTFWSWFAADYETDDPMKSVPRPKGHAKAVPVLAPGQLKAVFAAAKDQRPWYAARDTAIVWLLLESGVRRAELANLDVEDVDLLARTVVVRCGKGGKSRVTVFGDETASALHKWMRKGGRTSGALFVSAYGHRVSLNGLAAILNRVGDKAGVKLRPHLFRHCFAHYSLASGVAEGDLMEVAGWSTRTMLDRYGATLKRERALAAMAAHPVGKAVMGR